MMGMRNLVWPVFLALVLFATIEAKRRYRWGFMDGRPLKDHYAIQAVGADSAADCYMHPENYGVNTFYFEQPLDQFDSSNNAKWQQQVQWKNTSFKPKDDGDVVFLMIGGEGPVPTPWMCFMNYTWTQLAEQHGAFMFQLEHRYFGNSTPTSNMSVPNLKWLTTEQAMADINKFIPAMNAKFKFNNPKWVAFGGSYPGTISALLRKFYPNITLGNIASSAPLWAKVDFWEYAEKMQQAILWESQKNDSNAACYNETRNAFSDAKNKLYTKAGRDEYNNVFNIQPSLGSTNTADLDASNFLSLIFSSFQGIIQYTFDDRSKSTENKTSGLNVANLCKIMVDTSTSYSKRLKQVYDWEQGWDTPGYNTTIPFNNDYWADLAPFMNVSFNGDQASMRGWMWLSCNEFGWLQTTDNGYGIFGNIISLNFFLQQCTDMFDKTIDNAYIQNQVSASLQRFGLPQDFRATNVVLPNGSLDPWSTLGCNVTVNSTNQFTRTTVGGAHCVDMYPYDPAKYPDNTVEPADVNATIQLVKDQVAYYLTFQPSLTTQKPTVQGASMTSVSMVTIFVGILIHFVKLFL